MRTGMQKWLNNKYPQNYIIRKPLAGTLIIMVFLFAFLNLYKPFGTHASGPWNYVTTMAIYAFLSGIFLFIILSLLKFLKWFSGKKEWTIMKELLAIPVTLFILGIAIYFLGFLIEPSETPRWNISTILNSISGAFLIGIFPLSFFAALNYRYLAPQVMQEYNTIPSEAVNSRENIVRISSQLKKEELSFYRDEFIFAESDGNYVVFHLGKEGTVRKESIRNSINNIEQQLSDIPYFLRIHRAFIVNLRKVRSKQGNSLGYQIKLTESEPKIPVSRNKTKVFDDLFARYHN
jgi:hypothetical protein